MICYYPECTGGQGGTICRPDCALPKKQAHGEGCWSWGPRHYLCAYDEITRLRAELEKRDAEIRPNDGTH